MDADLDTLATELYVRTDDARRGGQPPGSAPKISDAELITLAVMQALLDTSPRPGGCAMPAST